MAKITVDELLTPDGRRRWLAAIAADEPLLIDGTAIGFTPVRFNLDDRFRAIDMLIALDRSSSE